MGIKLILILILNSCFYNAFAKGFGKSDSYKRISLMSYTAYLESQTPFDLDWNKKTSYNLSLMTKAYAYQEGDTCLVLGFQSKYKNGLCRLSLAKDASSYKNSCSKGLYPCNPQVFGENNNKPFCVSSSLGNELSKYCSFESIKSTIKPEMMNGYSQNTQKLLNKINKIDPRDFELSSLLELTQDEEFNNQLSSIFQDPYTLENSKKYTNDLCQSIYASKESQSFKLDLNNCNAQLEILSSKPLSKVSEKLVEETIALHDKKIDKSDIDEIVNEILTEESKEEEKVDETKNKELPIIEEKLKEKTYSKETQLLVQPERTCEVQKEKSSVEANLENFQDLQKNLDASLYMKCINELYYNDELPKEARGKYFHKLGDQLNFAKQCWDLDNHGEKEIIYTFVSEEGFKVIKFPVYNYTISNGQIKTSLPRNLLKFYDGDKPYYISQFNNIGQYFDSLPVSQLSQFLNENEIGNRNATSIHNKYVKAYENFLAKDNKSKNIILTTPEEAGLTTEDAKSCLKDRLKDYLNIIMFRSHGDLFPHTKELNADLQTPNRRTVLKEKYSKTTEEKKLELKAKILPEESSCKTIFTDKEFDDTFNRAYGGRIENYNKYRNYFID